MQQRDSCLFSAALTAHLHACLRHRRPGSHSPVQSGLGPGPVSFEGTEAETADTSNLGGLDPASSAARDDDPDLAAQEHIRIAFRAADDNMDEETADSWYAQVKQKYGSLIKLTSQEDVSESALAELIQGARFSYF